ncbi:hypothetical protein ABZP36_030918 [Zizania latifolia]
MQLFVNKLRVDSMTVEKLQGMTSMVTSLARLFAVLHTTVKFESLHMLTALLSQKESVRIMSPFSIISEVWAFVLLCVIVDVIFSSIYTHIWAFLTFGKEGP